MPPAECFFVAWQELVSSRNNSPVFLVFSSLNAVSTHYKHVNRYHTEDGLCFQKISAYFSSLLSI